MDKYNLDMDNLTPSAKKELERILIELRDKLLQKAIINSKKQDFALEEISLRDIITAYNDFINDYNIFKIRKSFILIISIILVIFGLTIIVTGSLTLLDVNSTPQNSLPFVLVLMIGLGMILSALYYFVSFMEKNVTLENENKLGSSAEWVLVKRWNIIESLTSDLMIYKGYTKDKSKSVNNIISFLSNELEHANLYISLKKILRIRNEIIHDNLKLNPDDIKLYINESDKIIRHIEKRLTEYKDIENKL